MSEKIKVLIVDSSAVFRQTLTNILTSDPLIEVIATASDPYIAARKMTTEVPDVITTDIEMPRMNGITFLKKIMSQHPIPVVIISHIAEINMEFKVKALACGASEVISKSAFEMQSVNEENKIKICSIIKSSDVKGWKKICVGSNVNQ